MISRKKKMSFFTKISAATNFLGSGKPNHIRSKKDEISYYNERQNDDLVDFYNSNEPWSRGKNIQDCRSFELAIVDRTRNENLTNDSRVSERHSRALTPPRMEQGHYFRAAVAATETTTVESVDFNTKTKNKTIQSGRRIVNFSMREWYESNRLFSAKCLQREHGNKTRSSDVSARDEFIFRNHGDHWLPISKSRLNPDPNDNDDDEDEYDVNEDDEDEYDDEDDASSSSRSRQRSPSYDDAPVRKTWSYRDKV